MELLRVLYPGNIRDIAFAMSRDGGRTFAAPVRVSEDEWELEGCPDDGPAMAIDKQNRIHIVWPTLVTEATAEHAESAENTVSRRAQRAPRLNAPEPTIALFYASSTDGRRFTARERIPTGGMPHHPQIAIASDGSLVMAWDELAKGTRRAAYARASLDRTGRPTFTRTIVSGDEPALYSVVAATPDATIAA